jgi:hypothetical protein
MPETRAFVLDRLCKDNPAIANDEVIGWHGIPSEYRDAINMALTKRDGRGEASAS